MQYAIFSKVFGDVPLETVADRAAAVGFDGVEPMGRAPHLPPDASDAAVAEAASAFADAGLSVPCIASYTGGYVGRPDAECEAELEALEGHLAMAGAFDCDLVRHAPGGPVPWRATDADYAEAARWLRRAADRADDYGVRLAVEVHAGRLTGTVESAVRLLDAVDRENVGAIHDAGNTHIVGVPSGPETVDALGDRLFHVHVKDEEVLEAPDPESGGTVEAPDGESHFRPRRLGEGGVPFGPVVRALVAAGYDGTLTLEPHLPTDGLEGATALAEHDLHALRELVERAGE